MRRRRLPLLRQLVYCRLAGCEDTNHDERLAQEPAIGVIVAWQGTDKRAASTNTVSRFETEVLTQEENLKRLAFLNVDWRDGTLAQYRPNPVQLMGSISIPTRQQGNYANIIRLHQR